MLGHVSVAVEQKSLTGLFLWIDGQSWKMSWKWLQVFWWMMFSGFCKSCQLNMENKNP